MKNKVILALNGQLVEVELTSDQLKELEVVEQKKELNWLLERKEEYYCKYSDNNVHKIQDKTNYVDNIRLEAGNYYSSEKVAEKSIDNLANKIKTWTLEENERTGWAANWNDGCQAKCCIYYDNEINKYEVGHDYVYKEIGVIYTSEESAEKLCELLNDGWR